MAAGKDFQAAMLGAAGVQTGEDVGFADRPNVIGIGNQVVDAFTKSAIGREGLSPAIEVMTPGIDKAADEDTQLHGLRPEAPNTAAAQAADAVRGFDMAVNVDGLVEIQHAVGAPAQGVQDMVGILGTETGEDHTALQRLAGSLGRLQMNELGAIGDVGAAVAGFDSGGDKQPIGEDGDFVRFTFALGILQDDNFVVGLLARNNLGIDFTACHP